MSTEAHIESLLDAVHVALMRANFAQLEALTPDVELAMTALSPRVDRYILARLHSKAKRNADAALAAGKGVRSAIQRLEDVRKNADGLMIYDENGKRPGPKGGQKLSQRL